MIKFRIYFVSVFAIIFFTLSARTGYAQMQCVANAAVPPTIRSEGLAERVGDYVMDCSGGIAGAPVTVNFTLFLNTAVTSRILALPSTTEALLLIDEPAPGAQVLNVNVFPGLLSGGNSISWQNISFAEPGAGAHRIFRLTNVRANANGIAGSPSMVQALLSSSAGVSIMNPVQVVAFGLKGMNLSASKTTFDRSLAPGVFGNPSQFTITFSEGFPAAYRKKIEGSFQDIPGLIFNTESGFTSSATGAAGLADTGTRLVARFSNVPSGVSLSVPTTVTSGSLTAVLMTGMGPDFSGGIPAASGDIGLAGGSGVAVWEITNADPVAVHNITIPVTVSYAPGILGGTASVSGSLGPISTLATATASATDPLPRFVDQAVTVPAFQISIAIPTMNEWGMLIFVALSGLGSIYHLRRSAVKR